MEYIRCGQTGLKVSQLCLGTMSMGGSAWKGWVLDEDGSIPILRRAVDLGITFFDMADWYSAGRNEEVVGQNLLRIGGRPGSEFHHALTGGFRSSVRYVHVEGCADWRSAHHNGVMR
jgi:diketogulonate reductase-like aldo/keto reductase